MPYYRVETYTTTGTKVSWNLDGSIASFNTTIAVTPTNSTATVAVQYTLNPLNGPTDTDASANWINSTLNTTIATTTIVAFTTPVSRIRLLITAMSSTAVVMEMNQGLSAN